MEFQVGLGESWTCSYSRYNNQQTILDDRVITILPCDRYDLTYYPEGIGVWGYTYQVRTVKCKLCNHG